ncbi:MAG: D-alanyl-D-alanine carboxypeptidase [Lachnospiraceae bacterium]|jgi:D-alanyl-D-alanine carboxypeptidase (penicillin-binding protein 5/6)|nr:D-alanyl-D-alanine carboxypeptidase [Lachnospiraceae bacterium]
MRIVKNMTNNGKKRMYCRVAAIITAAALFCVSEDAVSRRVLHVSGHEEVFVPAVSDGVQEKEAGEELQLYAQAAVLMDADSGRVLYGKNEEAKLPMASTTKIMTCILALEYGSPEEIVEVSSYAASMPKVKLYVKSGEKYYLRDLLYSLMLESHNDSAVVIAEAVGGSVEKFAAMMNQKARDIGCYDSYFITPNGLDAKVNETGKVHSTTAADLARIMAYCVTDSPEKERFLEITRTQGYDFTDVDGTRSFHCNNHNAFLGMMQEALSGKTGFTNNAGYCYVGAVESEGRIFTVALLACGWPNNRSYKWSDMKKLAAYGMERYQYRDIYEEQAFAAIPVRDGIAGEKGTPFEEAEVSVTLQAGEKSLPYLLCEDDRVEVKSRVEPVLDAPVAAGEEVGSVSYYLNGELIKSYTVCADEAIEKRSFPWIFIYILKLTFFL